ncbi:MAG: glycosyltransferase family 4 protein [Enhydrobacter sp.]|nr:glycosyltransferase family 4 protein [Enhydrobacter sp.]
MTARMLALVSDCYGMGGGIARYNQDLVEGLAEGGAQILVLPRHGRADGIHLPAGISQEPPVFNRLWYSVKSLWIGWRRGPFDVVFCGHVYMAPIAWVVARLIGARYWLQTHGTDVWESRPPLRRRAIEAADMVTAVSRGTRHILLGWVHLPPECVRVLPDTVGDRFVPGPPSNTLRDRFALGSGPILLAVGRLSASERYKGHEQVFGALPALRAEYPNLVYAVAGGGDDRRRLEQRARELAGESAVRFLGFVSEEDLLGLYRLADLYVMPSTQEGFGIVYLEAAACGLRVVGGVGGGSADAVPDERVGVLVDPSDRAALVAAIASQLARGKVDPVAVEPYRKAHFAAAACRLLARLMTQPRRRRGAK